ncbi:MAG: hypothetical protein N3A38_09780, partial [Planctomycetota bacterium]|nr:hypothetical protein [Planctomycetota bacterium]
YERIKTWMRRLSDGYVLVDDADLYAKVDGPFVVDPLTAGAADEGFAAGAEDAEAEAEAAARRARSGSAVWVALPVVDLTKPYFIGRAGIYASAPPPPLPAYAGQPAEAGGGAESSAGSGIAALKKTVLNEVHRAAGARMVPFAGWEMPVEYPTGIFREHAAVRSAAGLFDVSHMGVFEVAGKNAMGFLDAVLANCVTRLDIGQAQYSYMLYPDGLALDDLYVYRIERDRFLLVVNAANSDRDMAWLQAAASGRYAVDADFPGTRLGPPERLRDLRNAGADSLIDIALQGPLSTQVLCVLCDDAADRAALRRSVPNSVRRVRLRGIPVFASRTGYTGEPVGYEIFVHPDRAADLWNAILQAGSPMGVRPAGLGARDSTRVEAGFPLFGHELEGPHGINLTEAGYGFVNRFHVPFYVGRKAFIARAARDKRHILRLKGTGRRSIRPGHIVLDESGKPAATVTSFAFTDPEFTFYALAIAAPEFNPEPGSKVRAVRLTADQYAPPPQPDKEVELEVCTRFASPEEKENWRRRYLPFAGT